jgi:hypothetical protein
MEEYSRRGSNQRMRPKRAKKPTISNRWFSGNFRPALTFVRFFREHRGQPLPSAALMSPISRTFVAKLERFVVQHEIPLVQFRKGQRKDTVMAEHLGKFLKQEGVVFVGKAQEKDAGVPHRETPEPGHRPAPTHAKEPCCATRQLPHG